MFFKKCPLLIVEAIILSLFFAFAVFAWTEPIVAPPGGDVPAPINTGMVPQAKPAEIDAAQFRDFTNNNYFIDPYGNSSGYSAVLKGNVGIGITTPGAKLDVRGSEVRVWDNSDPRIYIRDLDSTRSLQLQVSETEGLTKIISTYGSGGLYPMAFFMGGGEKMRITTTGRVGIGDISPDTGLKLDVEGNVGADNYCDQNGDYCYDILDLVNVTGASLWSELSGNVYRSTGNVGIGITSPDYSLHIRKDQNEETTLFISNESLETGAAEGFLAGQDDISKWVGMFRTNSSFNSFGTIFEPNRGFLESADTGGLFIGSRNASGKIGFFAGGFMPENEHMRITSSGNVGIGLTSPGANLDIASALTGGAGSHSGEPVLRLTQTVDTSYNIGDIHSGIEFYSKDSTGDFPGAQAYIRAITTRLNGQSQADAGLVFGTSGLNDPVAGDLARDVMIIDGEGNVGIGATSPAYPLDVTGDANASRLCIAGDCRDVWPSGGAGGVGGSGSANVLAKWQDGSTLTNSIISDDGSEATVGGALNINNSLMVKDGANYFNISQVGGYSYLADSTTYNNYFLRGNGADTMIRGDLYVYGSDVRDNGGNLRLSGEDNLYLTMDYNNNDADTRAIMFGKNDEGGDTNWTELMRVDEDGSVGIGTTNPSALLDVDGSAEINGKLDMTQHEIDNMVLDKRTSDPVGAVEGQIWMRTNL